MPPGVLRAVMHRTTILRTVPGRAGEPGTALEIEGQIQPGPLRVELAAHHPPRPAQPQRRREQPQLIHTPTTPCYATITDSHAPNETPTPSSTRHAAPTPT